MRLPAALRNGLTAAHEERWTRFYAAAEDRDRTCEEGIWRRTQKPVNADESGWRSSGDQRRRVVHYKHSYGLSRSERGSSLEIVDVFTYYSLSLPEGELAPDIQRVRQALSNGGWRLQDGSRPGSERWRLGELFCSFEFFNEHPEDRFAGRSLPPGYRSFDVIIASNPSGMTRPRLPWDVLANGMRIKDQRGNPAIIEDLSPLTHLLPFHVELGCGPSIEAGVPALHHLHEIYRVTDLDTGRFIFGGPRDDLVARLLLKPGTEFPKLARLYESAFMSEPTPAHRALKALSDHGCVVGPVMTNNFDGLAHRCGLSEQFLRRYDEAVPHVEFDPRAKSLLVIGSHADRRRVQARARARGLKVIYLDPEGYWFDGRFIDYPLEGPCDGDLLCRKGATTGLAELCSMLGLGL